MTQADRADHTGDGGEPNQPNEYGYAGGASTPEPTAHPDPSDHGAEDVAVPAGDLTGAVSDAIDNAAHPDDATR
jgi:hypothetical protein